MRAPTEGRSQIRGRAPKHRYRRLRRCRRQGSQCYEEPGCPDDELLAFDNVILTPHMAGSPRSNGLRDMEELITGLARALLE